MESCIYRGPRAAPALRAASSTPSATGCSCSTSISTSSTRCSAVAGCGRSRRRNLAAWHREDYLGDAARAAATRPCATRVEEATGRRPTGPIRLLTHLRYFGYGVQPGQLLLLLRRRWPHRRGDRRRDHEHAVERAPRLRARSRCRRDRDRRCAALPIRQDVPRLAVHGDGPRYDWRFGTPGPRLAVHMENRHDGERWFDATLSTGAPRARPAPSWRRRSLASVHDRQGDRRHLLAGAPPLAEARTVPRAPEAPRSPRRRRSMTTTTTGSLTRSHDVLARRSTARPARRGGLRARARTQAGARPARGAPGRPRRDRGRARGEVTRFGARRRLSSRHASG